MAEKYKHDVAISFARADRNIALSIYLALKLKAPEMIRYYYPERQEVMLGRKLKDELQEIYRHDSKCVVIVVSKNYIDPENEFVQAEIEAFIPRYMMEKSAYLIPIMIDETLITEVHKELKGITKFPWEYNPEHLAQQIKEIVYAYQDYENSSKNKSTDDNDNETLTVKGNTFKGDAMFGNNNTINKNNSK
ncbi:hypothetical protein IMCC3317_17930 [Kordia antarctica]|uniref:TIR domain-containing protein n=1 Tax=Kordia antarctica TaxID=1218801 RepID=A0A7L4ZIS4_9FLAO|nr:toll/interleukin-1 receptor domain-containing protein [Kordia antarctica]QHI36430.1 hypothetical protein IMCC3317_17930 [Kordia antarctica]